jgi:hypothetical protein
MKQFFLNLLAESSNVSMTRFLSLMCVLTACAIAIYGMWTKTDLNQLIGLCSTFLGFGLGAKVVQKNFETKQELEVTNEEK